jgi:NADH-quinone oxidoreductase subunit E
LTRPATANTVRAAVPGPTPFSDDQQRALDAEVARLVAQFPPERKSAALIPALAFAQQLIGWLPAEGMLLV